MKNVTSIFLMLLYLIPTIGITISVHYCGGKVTSISFNTFYTKHKCSCGSMKMPKDCCKDEFTTIKLDDNQQKTQQISSNIVKITDFQPTILTSLSFDYHSPFFSFDFDHFTHPPDCKKNPLYIQHCVFRI